MNHRVVFSPEALEQLAELYRYIAEAASPDVAAQYTEAIVSYCESLRTFPLRGTQRDDVRPGLRITNYKKRTVIAFNVDADVGPSLVFSMAGKTTKRSCATTRNTEH